MSMKAALNFSLSAPSSRYGPANTCCDVAAFMSLCRLQIPWLKHPFCLCRALADSPCHESRIALAIRDVQHVNTGQ